MPILYDAAVVPIGLDSSRAWQQPFVPAEQSGRTIIVWTVPDGEYNVIDFLATNMSTVGAGGQRAPLLRYDYSNAGPGLDFGSSVSIGPNSTQNYTWGTNVSAGGGTTWAFAPVLGVFLPPRLEVFLLVTGASIAGDGFSGTTILISHFPWTGEGDPAIPIPAVRPALV